MDRTRNTNHGTNDMTDGPTYLGLHTDTEHDLECQCWHNTSNEPVRFFNAVFGPHGQCPPGDYWVTATAPEEQGFSLSFTKDEFEKRFRKIDAPTTEPTT